MRKKAANNAEVRAIITAALCGELTGALAARVYELGRDATIAFLLAVAAHAARNGDPAAGPHAPSGSIPVYKKPGARNGRGRSAHAPCSPMHSP